MYKTEPWTLNEKELEVRKTPYIKNREADLAVSTARIRKFMEDNKAKIFTNNEIAESLGMSLGTVSNITNRLESIGDIKIVRIRQKTSALSQVFQHVDGPLPAYTKERGKRDAILNVLDRFRQNPDEVFTKDDLVKVVNNTENKIRLSLQILLLNGTIKLIGSKFGKAQYQYKTGNKKGLTIWVNSDENYCTVGRYLKNNNLKIDSSAVTKELSSAKFRLFYSSTGLSQEYHKDDISKAILRLNNKEKQRKGFLSSLFS